MHQRPIVGASTAGSITRRQARHAAKAVKTAKSRGKGAGTGTSSSRPQSVSASMVERYLGHFGSVTAPPKNGSGVKTSHALKPSPKKLAPKEGR